MSKRMQSCKECGRELQLLSPQFASIELPKHREASFILYGCRHCSLFQYVSKESFELTRAEKRYCQEILYELTETVIAATGEL